MMPDWIVKIFMRWVGDRLTGSLEIHFNQGKVTRLVQHHSTSAPTV